MRLPEMNAAVGAELVHIPAHSPPQRELRAVYQAARMASLGRKRQIEGTALDIVQWSIGRLQDHHPDHTFQYDEAYFRSAAGSG